MIEILSNGPLNLVQDLGRPGHLPIGVSGSGAMDAPALAQANWMVGNPASAAGLEIGIFPFRLRFHTAMQFACTGATTTLRLQQRTLASWWSAEAQAGEELTIAPPTHGARVYLSFAGGIDVPLVLGSRSTDLKSGFGGFKGRGLRKGDQLALGAGGAAAAQPLGAAPPSRWKFAEQLAGGTATIRALPAAEYEQFTDEAISALHLSEYRLTPDCNRQGYRLEGTALKTRRPLELLSHGLVPGTVQVPPSGQPIIQLAEANTCGGYPKVATVIECDLWRVAQLRPGQRIRFELVSHGDAVAAVRAQADEQARIEAALAQRLQRAST